MAEVPMKRCTKCKQEFPATTEYFHVRNDRPCGLTARCRECRSAAARNWNEAHKERHIANVIRWQKDNPDQKREIDKRYVQRNIGHILITQRHWKAANHAKLLNQQRERRRTNPEKHRASNKHHYEGHKEASRIRIQRRLTKKRSLTATFTAQDWQCALNYFHGCCAYCGNPPSLFDYHQVLHQDHFQPLNKGGGYTPDNIVPACQTCNSSKNAKRPETWLTEYFGKRKAKAILKHIQGYFEWLKDNHA